MSLLEFLLRERPPVVPATDLRQWWSLTKSVRDRFPAPAERAVAAGFVADRVGFAFAAGYEAALHALVPSLGPESIASFCVTEDAGNHPRAIATRLEAHGDEFVLTGSKRFSTMAPLSDVLVVIATTGVDDANRPRLRAVRVDAGAPKIKVTPMPAPPFVPEVPHAELAFDAVRVTPDQVLPGDGYTDFTKAFRTIEDIHVNGALLGYLVSLGARYRFPEPLRERLIGLVVGVGGAAGLDPRRAATHVALAGLLREMESVIVDAESSFLLLEDAERGRWYRDRALAHVASKARELRRERAWQDLGEDRK